MSPRLKVLCALAAASSLPTTAALAQPTGGVIKPADEDAPLAAPIKLEELEKLIGGHTTLKFDFKEAPASEIAAEIARQTGLKVTTRVVSQNERDQPGYQEQRFTLHAEGQPFWSAVLNWNPPPAPTLPPDKNKTPAAPVVPREEYAGVSDYLNMSTSGVGVEKKSPGDGYELGQSYMLSGRVQDRWPGLFIAHDISRGQNLSLRRNAEDEELFRDRLRVKLQIYIEPRLRLAQVPARCDILEAVDDKGQDLRVPWRVRGETSPSGSGYQATILLLSRPGMGRKLSKLRGVLRFVVVSRSQRVELTDLDKPFEQQIYLDGKIGTLRFNGLQPESTGWKLKFEAQRSGDDLGRWFANSIGSRRFGDVEELSFLSDLNSSFRLYDRDGQQLFNNGGGSHPMKLTGQNGEVLNAPVSPPPPDITKWNFTESTDSLFPNTRYVAGSSEPVKIGPPVRLIAELPIERREVSVPFEFTDLPLPPS